MELQILPIGEQSFVKLRTKNRLYVDKTEFIYRMIQNGTYYFLSRPRRFGKSLLLSTIEAYFQGQRELFNGLYVDNPTRIALDQIKSKEYALPWSLDNREKILIGLNFSTTTRRPDNWLIERADGSLIEGVKNAREQEREQEGEQVKEQVKKLVLALGKDTKKREELMQLLQLAGRRNFKQNYIDPSIDEGYMAMLYPEAPNRKDQAYYLTDKGLALLAELTKEW